MERKCILILDDEVDAALMVRVVLSKNYFVMVHHDVKNVVEKAKHVKPDLILMDLHIADLGGDNATLLLKEHPETKHIPVLLFSGSADLKEISERVGAQGYISKPFTNDLIKKSVDELLGFK
jgi:CheY-like chemotaxis protein